MKYGKKLLLLPIILLLGLFFAFALRSYSLAQSPNNYDVTISPVFFDLSTTPGSTISDKIRIRNNTSSPLSIKLEIKRLTGDLNGDLTLSDENNDGSLSWIRFSTKTFTATPLEWTDVPFKISVPSSAAYGYYYAISLTQANSSTDKSGTAISGAAAVPILLNVRKEGARAEANITKFSSDAYVVEYLPANFNVTIENTGNIHVRPQGNIFISAGKNNSVASLELNQNLSNIIPHTKKTFTASWSDGFLVKVPKTQDGEVVLDKNGKPETTLAINWDKLTSLRIGKYTANLVMVYDNGTRDIPLESSISFWVFPYKIVIASLIGIVFVIFLVRWFLRRYINKEVRRRSR